MKHIYFIILACAIFAPELVKAQRGINGNPYYWPRGTQRCGIWFDYDASGNRVKRYYDCQTSPLYDDGEPGPFDTYRLTNSKDTSLKSDILVIVAPNPNHGKFSIDIPSNNDNTHYHIYDNKGSILTSGNFSTRHYDIDISNQPAGIYNVVIYCHQTIFSNRIIKF